DRHASQVIGKMPTPAWILFGEFHCARNQIPKKLFKLKPNSKITDIQQNEDRLALKRLKDFGSKKTLIFKSGSKHPIQLFCLLHTPLWVKWQSYLDHAGRIDEQKEPLDVHEQISWSIETLYQFLDDPRYPKL